MLLDGRMGKREKLELKLSWDCAAFLLLLAPRQSVNQSISYLAHSFALLAPLIGTGRIWA